MKMDPKVSIIIPVYNGSNYLQEAIDSALAQTYKNIEIIVVNDGSNDSGKTEKIALSYGESIRYFYKPNGGVATALNLGIEKMKGEYFSWLSHDDLYLPDKIEQEMICLKEQTDSTTIIAEGYQVIDSKKNYIATVNMHKQYPKSRLKNPLFLLLRGGINGCALLIHKSHFERVGVFNEKLPTTQDYDLWFRMFRNCKIFYMQTSQVLSRYHAEQDGKRLFESHMKECDQLWIKMMEELTAEEKINLGETEIQFYRDLWFFLETTNYNDAIRYAKYKMLDCAIKEYYRTGIGNELSLACTLLGIKQSILLKNTTLNFIDFCPEKYECLQQHIRWNIAGPVRLFERMLFFLREGNLSFFLQKFIRIWKRDGMVMVLKKMKRKMGKIKKGNL